MYAKFWWGNLTERDHFEDLGVDGRILKIFLKETKWDGVNRHVL
jgi:hypothetical protein